MSPAITVSSEIIIFKPRLDLFTAKFHLMFSCHVQSPQPPSLPGQVLPEMFRINSCLTMSLVTDRKNYIVFSVSFQNFQICFQTI